MDSSNTPRQGQIMVADDAAIDAAAQRIRAGGIVALPTETVYGLAADASNADAVAAIYRAKGRPDFNPLIVHVPDVATAESVAIFDDRARQLAATFWPGPLTLVLPLHENAPVAAAVTAGLPTIALRVPAHPVMQALLAKSGRMIAAPSANASGGISPTTAQHVADSLDDAVPLILDGGACVNGLESTIIALRDDGWEILRPGPIDSEQIAEVLGEPPIVKAQYIVEAPGQMASHYAPKKPLYLNVATRMADCYWIGFGEWDGDENLSPASDLAAAAEQLFAALHRADASSFASIAVAPISQHGIGIAINDRLKRAAT